MKHMIQRRHVGQNDLFDGFRKRMGDVFQEFFGEMETSPLLKSDFVPKIDVDEDEEKFTVRAEIPGVEKSQVEVELKKNILTIKGEKKKEDSRGEKSRYFLKERVHGVFERSFSLPASVDAEKTKAVFKDGVLLIEIPKLEEKKTQNRITVE